jgi:TDG/mug DNA glycosylase family protein
MKGPDLSSYEADILARDLDVIFCGVNPAMTAAVAGHNFSSRSNRFWTVLHLAGFSDVRLQPAEERRLLEYRCGLTAVVDRPTRRAIDVPPDEFRKARPGFETKVRRHAPPLGRLSRQARLLGDDGSAGRRMGPVSRRVCRYHGLAPGEPQRPQQSLLPRGASKGLRRGAGGPPHLMMVSD